MCTCVYMGGAEGFGLIKGKDMTLGGSSTQALLGGAWKELHVGEAPPSRGLCQGYDEGVCTQRRGGPWTFLEGRGLERGLCVWVMSQHTGCPWVRLRRTTVALGLILLVGNSYWEHATQAVSKWLTLLL